LTHIGRSEKVLVMRLFITVLVLIFSLQSWSKADDIRDLEIEGISIGDSLLDFYELDEINSWKKVIYPSSDKYFKVDTTSAKGDYDDIGFHLKKNDSKFVIYEIAGGKYFDDQMPECIEFKKKVALDISDITKNSKKDSYRYFYKKVENGKSYADIDDFEFDNGDQIRLWCVNWSDKVEKKLNFTDNFSISLTTKEHMKWINTEAYQ